MGARSTALDNATKVLNIFDYLGLKQLRKDYWAYEGRWFEFDFEEMLLNRAVPVKIIPTRHPDLTIEFRLDLKDPDLSVVKDTYAKFLLVRETAVARRRRKVHGNNT